MASNDLRTIALTAVVLLPLALGAGFLGAQFGDSTEVAPPAPVPVGSRDGGLLKLVDELDRRLEVLEEYRQRDEQRWQAAMDQINAALTRIEALERRRPAAAEPTVETTDGTTDAPEAAPPGETTEPPSIHQQLADQFRDTQHKHLIHRFKLLADTTTQGERDRKANAYMYAGRRRTSYPDLDKETLNEIYLTHMARAARDVGPLVADGLESADIATVRTRYVGLLAETDAKVANLLEGEERAAWEREREARRKVVDDVLASYQDKR